MMMFEFELTTKYAFSQSFNFSIDLYPCSHIVFFTTSLVTRALSKEAARSMAVRTVLGGMEFGRKLSLAEVTF